MPTVRSASECFKHASYFLVTASAFGSCGTAAALTAQAKGSIHQDFPLGITGSIAIQSRPILWFLRGDPADVTDVP